jgi:hypothetical protein
MSTPHRFPLVALAVVTGLVAGFASSRVFERTARAQSAPFASTIYVPTDGLAFRSFDGRVIARLWYDHRGGALDLYDSDERPSAGLRVDANVPVVVTTQPSAERRGSGRIDLGF